MPPNPCSVGYRLLQKKALGPGRGPSGRTSRGHPTPVLRGHPGNTGSLDLASRLHLWQHGHASSLHPAEACISPCPPRQHHPRPWSRASLLSCGCRSPHKTRAGGAEGEEASGPEGNGSMHLTWEAQHSHLRPERPLQQAAGGGLLWAAGRHWPSRAVTSLGLEPPLPLTHHVQGQPAYLKAGVALLEASQEVEQARCFEGLLSSPAPPQLLKPFLGTIAHRPLLGAGGPGRRLVAGGGAGRGGDPCSRQPHWVRGQTLYVLSYTKLFLGVCQH